MAMVELLSCRSLTRAVIGGAVLRPPRTGGPLVERLRPNDAGVARIDRKALRASAAVVGTSADDANTPHLHVTPSPLRPVAPTELTGEPPDEMCQRWSSTPQPAGTTSVGLSN